MELTLTRAITGARQLLHKACSLGLDDAVEILLAYDADPNVVTACYETPMMAACKNNHNRIVELLLARGVSEVLLAKVRTPHGTAESTPLHEAVRNGNEYLVNVLLSHGAAVDERNDKQETALHLATSANRGMLVETRRACQRRHSERRDAAVRSVSTWL
jgi:ankyrin repeat protein